MHNPSYDELPLLHFNDVYHITQPTALGRLSHVFRKAKDVPDADSPITIFSGDAFSPSLESAVLKGEHMVPILNHLLVDVACYGNHDFDFGENVLASLSRKCAFPWLLANVVHPDGRLLAMAKEYLVVEKKGYRIGFFGLAGTFVEHDWPSSCQHLPADCTILDPVSAAQRVSNMLRSAHGVDLVIAITHMRYEEDVHLARSCGADIDLILGGHDHEMAVHGADVKQINGHVFEGNIKLVKSGTDFKSFSAIQMYVTRTHEKAIVGNIRVHQTRDITLSNDISDDADIQAILVELQKRVSDTVDKPLFYTTVPLDGRTSALRTQETNLGNMVADAVRAYYDTDIAFINSGSLRCDRIIDAGVVTIKDMIDILPFDNPFVVKRLPGRMILRALENAACDIIDGRFLHVSGVTFRIDPSAPVGERVCTPRLAPHHGYGGGGGGDGRSAHVHLPSSGDPVPASPILAPLVSPMSTISAISPISPISPIPTPLIARTPGPGLPVSRGPCPLHAEEMYTVAMSSFIAGGYDGYAIFKEVPSLVDVEGAMTDRALFLQLFGWDTDTDEDGAVPMGVLSPIDRARAVITNGISHGLRTVSPAVEGRIEYTSTRVGPCDS